MSPLRSGYAGLHLAHDSDDRSAFGARQERAGGAAGVSLAAHVLFLLLTYAVVSRPDPSGVASAPGNPSVRPELVWLNVAGAGGGGGGGGNRTAAPPARLQTRGLDALSIPVLKPPPLAPPRDQPEQRPDPPPDIALNVPVKPMDLGQIPVVGAVDGFTTAPAGSQGSGANGGAGTGKNGGSGPGDGRGLGDGSRGGTGGDVFQLGNGITPPRVIRSVKPAYTVDAVRARIQGEVLVHAIVRPDGTVTDARVGRSLDSVFGLDEEALKAARQWRFTPATRMGQPVAVYVTIGVGFTMH